MSKRTYHQFCPLAYSLDVVGERWTLLIVRELLMGPRRYTDMLNGLPGIGTNLLANRLKALEEAGVIRQRTLPPPAASHVYELTEFGDGLRPVIDSLAQWGMGFINFPPPQEDFIGVVPAILALSKFFLPENARGLNATYEFRLEGTTLVLTIKAGELTLKEGVATAPDMIVETTGHLLLTLLGGERVIQDALSQGHFNILKGERALFDKLIPAFALPTTSQPESI